MRYSKEENTHILAVFNSGDTVVIDVYKLSDDTKVVNSAACSEIGTTGIFKYEFDQTITQKEEYLWIMTNGQYNKYGKIVLGGWMDSIDELLDIEEGNWEIKDKQMVFYKRDGSELMRFNLSDKSGHPTEVNVFKRERI